MSEEIMHSCALWSEAEGGVSRWDRHLEIWKRLSDEKSTIFFAQRVWKPDTEFLNLAVNGEVSSLSWYIDTIKRTKVIGRRTHQRGRSGGPNQSSPSRSLWHCSQIQKGVRRFFQCRNYWACRSETLQHSFQTGWLCSEKKAKDATVVVTSSTFPESRFSSNLFGAIVITWIQNSTDIRVCCVDIGTKSRIVVKTI